MRRMKKKLLFFLNGLYGGGAERIGQTLLRQLDGEKYDVTLYSLRHEDLDKNYPETVHYHYIFERLHKNSFFRSLYIRIINKLKLYIYFHFSPKVFYRLFIRGQYDVEVAFIEGEATRIIGGSTNKNSKKIAWVHIDLVNGRWTEGAYRSNEEERQSYLRYNQVICVSNDVRLQFFHLFPEVQNVLVKRNPIDEKMIRNLSAEPPVRLKECHAVYKLISIGRLVSQKGYDRLIPIVGKLIREGFCIHLTIIGTGRDEELLRRKIIDEELEENISLLGYVENPYPYLRQADLYVCSSRSEGYSTVVTESLILGIPIITTQCAGMDELLGNNEYGMIVPNDDKELYEGLKKVLENATLLHSLKEKSIERSKQISLQKYINSIEELF